MRPRSFVDGSGWEGVYKILRRDGYPVSIVQNPTISLADDVAVTRRAIGAQAVVTTPAWRTKPSFYLVSTADKMIPPPAQRSMAKRAGATVTEAEGSHAIFVSKPDVVVSVIERAATATSPRGR